VALWRARRGGPWLLPAALLSLAVALSFYQVRTLPFASAVAVPVIGAWLAGIHARMTRRGGSRLQRVLPVAAAFIVAIPFTWLLIGWAGEKAVALATNGRIAPLEQPKPDPALVKGLSTAERNCFDPQSAAAFAAIPHGLVLSPLFYGSTVLKISDHDVVAGPYHRNGQAILDSINAMQRPPADAKAIFDARKVDYVAICTTSQESAIAAHKAPDGLLAELLKGHAPEWLQPVPPHEGTTLRVWRVAKPPS